MTLSTSVGLNRPAWWRLPTISRIASSFPVACRSTRIASRTTKSKSFIRTSSDGPQNAGLAGAPSPTRGHRNHAATTYPIRVDPSPPAHHGPEL